MKLWCKFDNGDVLSCWSDSGCYVDQLVLCNKKPVECDLLVSSDCTYGSIIVACDEWSLSGLYRVALLVACDICIGLL